MNKKYNVTGNPMITDSIVIAVCTIFSSRNINNENLYPKIPIHPPKQFRITSSMSDAPMPKSPWVISTNKLTININSRLVIALLSFLNKGKYIPRGIKITILPATLAKASAFVIAGLPDIYSIIL